MSGSASGKKRNFTTQERNLLLEVLKEFKQIIENKRTDNASTAIKKDAWIRIAQRYNSSAIVTESATGEQLRRLWTNLKTRQREALTKERQHRLATGGGGPCPEADIDPNVAEIAPALLVEICNAIDSDSQAMTTQSTEPHPSTFESTQPHPSISQFTEPHPSTSQTIQLYPSTSQTIQPCPSTSESTQPHTSTCQSTQQQPSTSGSIQPRLSISYPIQPHPSTLLHPSTSHSFQPLSQNSKEYSFYEKKVEVSNFKKRASKQGEKS